MKKGFKLAAMVVLALSTVPAYSGNADSAELDAQFEGAQRGRRAWCVGGPRQPTYAFSSATSASTCSNNIAAASNACRQFVQVARCRVFSRRSIGAVAPFQCRCNPGFGPVGQWLR